MLPMLLKRNKHDTHTHTILLILLSTALFIDNDVLLTVYMTVVKYNLLISIRFHRSHHKKVHFMPGLIHMDRNNFCIVYKFIDGSYE